MLLHKPFLIVVVGLPGSGKTFFAEQFSKVINAPFIDYAYYRRMVADAETREFVINDVIKKFLDVKYSIILEGPGLTKKARTELAQLAQKKGYEPLFVWVQTDPAIAYKRVSSSMSKDEYDVFLDKFELLDKSETHVVISGKYMFQTQARMVAKVIEKMQSDITASAAANAAKPVSPAPKSVAQAQPAQISHSAHTPHVDRSNRSIFLGRRSRN